MNELPKKLLLRAVWGGRVDPIETQVAMVWDCMRRLAAHGGFLADPWYSLQSQPNEVVTIGTFSDLDNDMRQSNEDGNGFHYGFTQSTANNVDDALPNLWLSASLSDPRGWARGAANSVVIDISAGKNASMTTPLPVGWLLEIGAELVRDLVDTWRPDAASLDSPELLNLRPSKKSSYPVVGYASWFSRSVADPGLMPSAAVHEDYENGVLLGIDPCSSDPGAEASDLASSVYGAGALTMIPFVQGQANPT